jgi:hypothetical protein
MLLRSTLVGFVVAGLLAATPLVASSQTAAIPPQAGVEVGRMPVSGASWRFSSNLPNLGGPWGSVTVTNTNCTTPYKPGTAQAGAVLFTATLSPGTRATDTLQAFAGSAATGQVQLLPMADTGGTNVSVNLDGLEPFLYGNTLSVCLTLATLPPTLADINVGQQHVAATNFDVTGVATAATDSGQPLIAISGEQITADGTDRQMVFFFLSDQYLGTDTTNPSLAPVQLVGSPGQDQIAVSYADANGGSPVTITYTWTNGALDASDTPPGH